MKIGALFFGQIDCAAAGIYTRFDLVWQARQSILTHIIPFRL